MSVSESAIPAGNFWPPSQQMYSVAKGPQWRCQAIAERPERQAEHRTAFTDCCAYCLADAGRGISSAGAVGGPTDGHAGVAGATLTIEDKTVLIYGGLA